MAYKTFFYGPALAEPRPKGAVLPSGLTEPRPKVAVFFIVRQP
jgi:hypothetical protein